MNDINVATSRLLRVIDIQKFRDDLKHNVGSIDGFSLEHLELSDHSLVKEYLRVYGIEQYYELDRLYRRY